MSLIASPFVFDCSQILNDLYLGSRPQDLDAIRTPFGKPFDVVVFCAEEHQPTDVPAGLVALYCPLRESSVVDEDAHLAESTAKAVAEYVRQHKRVLVSCMYGRNRSGLVTALTLYELTSLPSGDCLNWVRDRRPGALMNRRLNEVLLRKKRSNGSER